MRSGFVRLFLVLCTAAVSAQTQTVVRPIQAPERPFPTEPESAGVTRFSFIAYADPRSACAIGATERGAPPPPPKPEDQTEHARIVEAALAKVAALASTPYPIRFVVQSGDAVYRGMNVERWNDAFVSIVEKLTKAGLWYFFAVGNHDLSTMPIGDVSREAGLRNTIAAMAHLYPPEDSPRRLKGY